MASSYALLLTSFPVFGVLLYFQNSATHHLFGMVRQCLRGGFGPFGLIHVRRNISLRGNATTVTVATALFAHENRGDSPFMAGGPERRRRAAGATYMKAAKIFRDKKNKNAGAFVRFALLRLQTLVTSGRRRHAIG